jgi:hypothetical protein
MSAFVATLLSLALLVAAGFGLRRLLGARAAARPDALASAVVLGIAACGVAGPLGSGLGAPAPLSAALALLALALLGALRKPARGAAAKVDPWLLAALAVPCALAVALALVRVVLSGDEVFVWGYKAAVIAATGRIDPSAWSHAILRGPAYPFALPVAGALPAAFGAPIPSFGGRAIALLAYGACALALARLARRCFAGRARVPAAFGLASMPALLLDGSTFMADAVFTGAIALALAELLEAPARPIAVAHVVALALLRLEGVAMAFLLLAAISLAAPAGQRVARTLASLAAALLALVPWASVLAARGLHPLTGEAADERARAQELLASLAHPEVLGERLVRVVGQVFGEYLPWFPEAPANAALGARLGFGLLLPALVLLAAARACSDARPLRWPLRVGALAVAAIVAGQLLPLTVAPLFQWQLEAAKGRAALHLVPAMLAGAALAGACAGRWIGRARDASGSEPDRSGPRFNPARAPAGTADT